VINTWTINKGWTLIETYVERVKEDKDRQVSVRGRDKDFGWSDGSDREVSEQCSAVKNGCEIGVMNYVWWKPIYVWPERFSEKRDERNEEFE
jgi:hypothetical protein